MLKEKYAELLKAIGGDVKNGEVTEADGKLQIKGTTQYQLDKDLFWDKLKTYPGWENEVAADLKVESKDAYGYYVVASGDSLSKIAKKHLDDPNRYMDIFNANRDVLSDPDLIKPGQRLKIPNKA